MSKGGDNDATNELLGSFDDHSKALRQIVIAVQKELHRSSLYAKTLIEENNELYEKCAEKERTNAALVKQAAALKQRKEDLIDYCDEREGEINDLKKTIAVLNERIDQLEWDNHELWRQKEELGRDVSPPKKQKQSK